MNPRTKMVLIFWLGFIAGSCSNALLSLILTTGTKTIAAHEYELYQALDKAVFPPESWDVKTCEPGYIRNPTDSRYCVTRIDYIRKTYPSLAAEPSR